MSWRAQRTTTFSKVGENRSSSSSAWLSLYRRTSLCRRRLSPTAIWCPLRIGDASYFEEVCSLVGQIVFLFNEGKDPFEAGGPLINLILFCIVAEHGDQAQELCQLSVTAF